MVQMKQKITKLLWKIDREGIDELIKYLKYSDYFQAPASTKFHGCYEGGLAEHSFNVYKLFKEKNQRFNLNLSEESIIICALLHDLCKVSVYSEKILKNGDKSTVPYGFKENLPLGHCTKSLFIINKFIKLTTVEALIIRWHMSWSDYEFKKHIDCARKIAPAIIAFICSDLEASSYLEG